MTLTGNHRVVALQISLNVVAYGINRNNKESCQSESGIVMVDRAGFGPATFRFLGQSLANRTFFGPFQGHTRLNYRPNVSSEVRLRAR